MSEEDVFCILCHRSDREEILLLCDGQECNVACHTTCINLPVVPPGNWYCPYCALGQLSLNSNEKEASFEVGPRSQVYLYERVSSKGQDQPEYGRVGLDTQNSTLLRFVLEKGACIVGTFTDVGTGREINRRKSFKQLITNIKPNSCILVYSVSRFGRNIAEVNTNLKDLHDKGCWVYSVSEKVSSKEIRFIQLTQEAENESNRLSTTMQASLVRRRAEGSHIGPAPFGYTTQRLENGKRILVKNPAEQAVIQYINNRFKYQPKINLLAKDLNNQGSRRRGKNWTTISLKKVLIEARK